MLNLRFALTITLLALLTGGAAIILPGAVLSDAVAAEADASESYSNNEIQRFCTNIADAARDRRYALKAAELRALQDDVEKRIAVLEQKSMEYEKWVARRDEFLKMANGTLIEIYAKMRPDAAAARLELLGVDLAAVILMKLSPRQAGVILNEMDASKAAMITGVMSASASLEEPS